MPNDFHWLVLEVNPEPWAIGPLSVGRRGGKVFPQVGRNMQLHSYKEAIKEAIGTPDVFFTGPIELKFFFWRRRDEYKTPQSRGHRKHEADLTNLQKATEDALQDIIFKNDKDVVSVRSHMMEQSANATGKVVIGIRNVTGLWQSDAMINMPIDVWQQAQEIGMPQEENDNSW